MKPSRHSRANMKSSSMTKTTRSIRVIHTTIRPERRINCENNKSIPCNSSTKTHSNHRSLTQSLQKNISPYNNSEKQSSLPDLSSDLSTSSRQQFNINFSDNYPSSSETKISRFQTDRKGTIKDMWKESNKNKRRKYFPHSCGHRLYLCIFLSFCCTLLIAIGIAAISVGLLIKTSKPSTTTTTTTKPLTTTLNLTSFIIINETVYGIWNTTAGSNGELSTPGSVFGNYNPSEIPSYAFDQNTNTKYTSYGICNQSSIYSLECGVNTGFYLTFQQGASLLTGIRFSTGNNRPDRDPLTITIEGSNQIPSALLLGSSWTLLYNDSTGLDIDPGRYSVGMTQIISNNIVPYNSYRVLVTSIRNISNAVQYSEVELFGY